MVPCYAHDVRVPPPGFFVNNQYRILLDQQGAGSRDFSLGEAFIWIILDHLGSMGCGWHLQLDMNMSYDIS